MPLVILRGSNIRVRLSIDGGTNWKLIDCEVDSSFTLANDPLEGSCKLEFFDTVEAGRTTGTGTINFIASDTKDSTALEVVSAITEKLLALKVFKLEFTEIKDDGTVDSGAKNIRGDAVFTSVDFTFEDHQFVTPSVSFTFSGEVDQTA